ncbi:putative homeobox-leucine zipper protein HOX26 [Phragmites australis]|uniref:putative homeobox-leucine zipper protein HOX26 n=1 Tax=Phragmites australis TaxID=29695 RepID=UPI002D7805D8|nr:putative homeobox-leucine zipper protein HOX26 [Phragmites australis]
MSSVTTAGSSMEEYSVEEFDTRLSLEIGGGGSRPPPQRKTVQLFGEVFSPQEAPLQDHGRRREPTALACRKKREIGVAVVAAARQKKKARTFQAEDGDPRSSSDSGGGARKKLRLTSVQATLLEDSFRAHNILPHAEKRELARRVGLSARQVEVWFQNRRARTKLKQTEVDCDLLRRWCNRLTDENARLRQDLAELRTSASTRLPAAAAVSVVCPSCCDKQLAIVAAGAAEME